MEKFYITPVEGLLLGLCWGEFAVLHNGGKEVDFGDILGKRLFLLFPNGNSARREPISEFPKDIKWWCEDEGVQRGVSNSHPESEFILDSAEKFKVKYSIRSFFTAKIECYLAECLGLKEAEVEALKSQDWDEFNFHAFVQTLQDLEDSPTNIQDFLGIKEKIIDLIRYNECIDRFQTGCLFGTAIGSSDQIKSNENHQHFYAHLFKALRELTKNEIILYKSRIANTVLCNAVNLLAPEISEYLKGEPVRDANSMEPHSISHRKQLLTDEQLSVSICLAFGEVIGLLSETEFSEIDNSRLPFLSNSYNITKNDSLLKIKKKLNLVKQQLHFGLDYGDGFEACPAEKAVDTMCLGVEALAKQFWDGQEMDSLSKFLTNKLRSERQSESRFASIALTLNGYRNKVVHGYDSFECSFEEADFFFAGMEALIKLIEDSK